MQPTDTIATEFSHGIEPTSLGLQISAGIAFVCIVWLVFALLKREDSHGYIGRVTLELTISLVLAISSFWVTGVLDVDGTILGLPVKAVGGFAVFVVALRVFYVSRPVSLLPKQTVDELTGFWAYALKTNTTENLVIGYFTCEMNEGRLGFHTGRAYYVRNAGEVPRGHWASEMVSAESEKVYVLYHLDETFADKGETAGATYRGLFELQLIGDGRMNGIFRD